jgi:hypothetical protein
MTSLAELLEQAANAEPTERIDYRNPISEYGKDAVKALMPWLLDPKLAPFAIRVVRICGERGDRDAAIAALRTVPSGAPTEVRQDAIDALTALGVRPTRASGNGVLVDADEFNDDLFECLVDAARAGRFLSYTEAGEVVRLSMANPYHRKLLGQLLGTISEAEALRGRPMLSSIVVGKGSSTKIGSGFFQLGEELHLKQLGEDEGAFARREQQRTFEFWRAKDAHSDAASAAPDCVHRAPHEIPPPAIRPCGFTGPQGQCRNPGRWNKNGVLSCTTHCLAGDAKVWRG